MRLNLPDDLSSSVSVTDSQVPGENTCVAYPLQDTPRGSFPLDSGPLEEQIQTAQEKLRRLSRDIGVASRHHDSDSGVSESVASLVAVLAPVRVKAAELDPDTLIDLLRRIERYFSHPCLHAHHLCSVAPPRVAALATWNHGSDCRFNAHRLHAGVKTNSNSPGI